MAKPKSRWSVGTIADRVHELRVSYPKSGSRFRFLALTDVHWDSAHCDRAFLKKHLNYALEENAPVVIVGDLFDIMQGRFDPRADPQTLRPEHRGSNYFDLISSTALEWFAPYSSILALITPGNHEAAVIKRNEIDLIDRLTHSLRTQYNSPVIYGEDWCYLLQKNDRISAGKADVRTKKIFLHHGYGGGGESGRGIPQHQATRSQWQADVFISGHIHRRNCDHNVVTSVSGKGKIETTDQWFVRCGSYKQELDCKWHISRGAAARPLGGWWITTEMSRSKAITTYSTFPEQP